MPNVHNRAFAESTKTEPKALALFYLTNFLEHPYFLIDTRPLDIIGRQQQEEIQMEQNGGGGGDGG